MLSLEMWANRN